MQENQDTAAVETAPTAEAPSVETPAEEPVTWDNLFDKAFETKEDVSEAEVKDPEAPFPSTKVEDKKEIVETQEAATADKTEEEPDEEPDVDAVINAKGDPFSLSRKQLREVEKTLLSPFRNPEAPISDVIEELYKFHPTRTNELFQEIVNEAAKAAPDQWLEQITGIEGLTVAEVKALKEAGLNPQRQEQKSDTSTEAYLTELYGEEWKDPANDENLLDEDKHAARAAREVLRFQAQVDAGKTESQEKLDKALKELEEVKDKALKFEEHQKAVFETSRNEIFQSSVQDYRSAVENRVIPKLFADLGVVVSEQDTDFVKEAKEFVQGLFKGEYDTGSHFDDFVTYGFSERESVKKAIDRVGSLLAEASAKEAQNKISPSAELVRDAAGLRKQAEFEQDSIAILTKKAGTEFAQSSKASFAIKALERIADLERQLVKGGRKEIIGNTVTSTDSDSWKADLKADPWGKALDERFAQIAR